MKKIIMESISKEHSHKDLWRIMTAVEDYPKWCKFCVETSAVEIKEGVIFYDTTTLLWIPLRIKHIVTKVKEYEELQYFLPLPGGGKMWHKFTFNQIQDDSIMRAEIRFDLGNKLFNNTVGYILEKRWISLLQQGFPGMESIKRISLNNAKSN